MVEDSGGLGLADEALLELLGLVVVRVGRGPDRLQGDEAADQRVLREIDDAHRALTQLANDFITTKLQVGKLSRGGRTAMSRQ
jgi:hypothetical protein